MKLGHRSYRCNIYSFSLCSCSVVISNPAHTISNSKHETSVAPSAIIDRNPRDLPWRYERHVNRKLFTCVIIHVHVCVSKGQTILSLQWTQLWEDKKQKFWIYNIHVICCVKKKFHFLERWSKHVLRWPHDTCMCFQAVCLEIIWSDPQEYCKFSLFGNSLQNSQNILFPLPSKLSHFYFPSMETCMFFWSKQVFQMLC